jgi:hypothetical protein
MPRDGAGHITKTQIVLQRAIAELPVFVTLQLGIEAAEGHEMIAPDR